MVLSASLAHMGIDAGLFAPYSPPSFGYVSLGPYRIPFLAGATIAAVSAGIVLRKEGSKMQQISEGMVDHA